MKRKWKKAGLYIQLSPGVFMPWDQEVLGALMYAAAGSGKTAWLQFVLDQIIRRGEVLRRMARNTPGGLESLPLFPDKGIIMDIQGDYVGGFPLTKHFALLAPGDCGRRVGSDGQVEYIGWAWSPAKDLKGDAAIVDFCAQVIELSEGQNKSFDEGARIILASLLSAIQLDHPNDDWTWRTLANALLLPPKEMEAYLRSHRQIQAANYFIFENNGAISGYTQSFLGKITGAVSTMVQGLADGWGDYPPERQLSLTEWVHNPMPDRPFLIFQMNSQIRELSRSWIKGALSVVAQQVKSADLTNDQRRRLWTIFDECPQYAAEDDDILEFFTTGRKKGVCPIIICQAPSQFEKRWGKPKYKTLETTVGIKLCGRLGAGEDAKEVASVVIGDSYWIQRKGNRNLGPDGGGTLSFEQFHEPLVLPNWFEQALGPAPGGKGVRIAWIGPSHVARLLIPFSPNWHRGDAQRTPHREGVVLADWVKRPRQAVISRTVAAQPSGTDQQGRRPRREATAEERARARQGSSQEDASHPGKPLGL